MSLTKHCLFIKGRRCVVIALVGLALGVTVDRAGAIGWNFGYTFDDRTTVEGMFQADERDGFLTNISDVIYTVDGAPGPTDVIRSSLGTAPIVPADGSRQGLDIFLLSTDADDARTGFEIVVNGRMDFAQVLMEGIDSTDEPTTDSWSLSRKVVPDGGATGVLGLLALGGFAGLRKWMR